MISKRDMEQIKLSLTCTKDNSFQKQLQYMEVPSKHDLLLTAVTCDDLADFLTQNSFCLEDDIRSLRKSSSYIRSTYKIWRKNEQNSSTKK